MSPKAARPPTKSSAPQRRGPGSRADDNHPTRVELLDAAVTLAEREGLHALSVAGITTAAGHAKGTFYVHFSDRAAFLVAMHRWFHDKVFTQIVEQTATDAPGPERVGKRLLTFLDACLALPGVRALLLEARTEPAIAAEVDSRNRQATATLAADLVGTCAHPEETARLLVLGAADIAARESVRHRRISAARAALLDLVPAQPES